MLLRENGSLERISDDEAKILMSTDNRIAEVSHSDSCSVSSTTENENQSLHVSSTTADNTFYKAVKKIITINKICKILINLIAHKKTVPIIKEDIHNPRSQKDIPDIVNSTFSDTNPSSYLLSEKRDKYLIPESISITLRTEKAKSICEEEIVTATIEVERNVLLKTIDVELDNLNHHKMRDENQNTKDFILQNLQVTSSDTATSSNPFLSDIHGLKFMNTFINTEYENNNSQSEEMQNTPVKILIEKENENSPKSNPFTKPDIILERPKTPLLKIISGNVKNRKDSVYVDSKIEKAVEETYANEFVNPFFMHQHHQTNENEERYVTDFIIGAPVSLPPIIRGASPDPTMESILLYTSSNDNPTEMNKRNFRNDSENTDDKILSTISSTPSEMDVRIRPTKQITFDETSNSSNFHSMDSNLTETTDDLNITSTSKNKTDTYNVKSFQSSQSNSPRRDTWDSAYVSIDDNNSSPDTNNNENRSPSETNNKKSVSENNCGLKLEELSTMGPAERELWQTCNDLKNTTLKKDDTKQEDIKLVKVKRSIFTPIIEESDRSISFGMKDIRPETFSKLGEDSVTMAFAELNEIYQEYFPHSGSSSITTVNEEHNKGQEMMARNAIRVDSASDEMLDVKRHVGEPEGTISEVQSNATESVSVSQDLHAEQNKVCEPVNEYKCETQFGDSSYTNIVLEKKKYWDERIRQIEEIRSEEIKSQQKKKRLCTKHLKHNDSLSKRKGKQIIKNFLQAGGINLVAKNTTNDIKIVNLEPTPQISIYPLQREQEYAKPVEKWKKYWDEKLETEKGDTETVNLKEKLPKSRHLSPLKHESLPHKANTHTLPVKHELPEEVFKAFETSPKRFFGTSRKQILNKIDAFLGKENTADESYAVPSEVSHDSGLVSSRITLFHNITQIEPLSRPQRKSKSLHNIYQGTEVAKSTDTLNEGNETSYSEASSPYKKTLESMKIETTKDLQKEAENIIALKDKRARLIQKIHHKSLDDATEYISETHRDENTRTHKYIKNIIKEINKQSDHSQIYKKNNNALSKTSISKSEMDIFNKITNKSDSDDLDKYKSYEELPKINVKNFISLYENVSKSSPIGSRKNLYSPSSKSGGEGELSRMVVPSTSQIHINKEITTDSPTPPPRKKLITKTLRNESTDRNFDTEASTDSIDTDIISLQEWKETTYLSLSDIELEIVENKSDKSITPSPEKDAEIAHTDYKSRFKMAKQYFQSLEELRAESPNRSGKLNECEILLYKDSTESNKSKESLVNPSRPQKRVKKNIKSHSMPSSEISKIWKQMQQETEESDSSGSRLVKISEKFNVEDLFSDVTEGKLSRQGSLRGVPHKKAVLETFRSMENVSDNSLSTYEIAVSQLSEFAKENKIKNAQTYLTEYPYLPTTAPSKYHSRLDPKASGLISMKELLNAKPRRNSVPDLRLNCKFTANL